MVKNNYIFSSFSFFFISAVFLIFPVEVLASVDSFTAFDSPLRTLRNVFTGPIAYTISLLSIIICGCMLVFGGEINEFAKRFALLVLVIALIVFAAQLLADFFGASGTVITEEIFVI